MISPKMKNIVFFMLLLLPTILVSLRTRTHLQSSQKAKFTENKISDTETEEKRIPKVGKKSNEIQKIKEYQDSKVSNQQMSSTTYFTRTNNYILKKYDKAKVNNCSVSNCSQPYGICLNLKTCVCKRGYLNVLRLNQKGMFCSYRQKRIVVAFLLELFIPLGFGHFYTGHYYLGASKFFLVVILPMLFVIFISWKYNTCTKVMIDGFTLSWYVVFALMFLVDVAFYATGIYRDGNDIPLLL